MENVLNTGGFNISTLNHADTIVKDIKKIKPDIVLLDIKLPRVSGAEAILHIKSDRSLNKIPVMAFTSYSMKGDKEKFMRMGYDGYISKPINARAFPDQVAAYLAKD